MHSENRIKMKNEKHKEILVNIIKELGVGVTEFRKKLGYKSNTTIYNIIRLNIHGISPEMAEKIMIAYPEVNYLYLKRGEGNPIKTSAAAKTMQNNIFSTTTREEENINIYEFLKLPTTVKKLQGIIEELQQEIELLKKAVTEK